MKEKYKTYLRNTVLGVGTLLITFLAEIAFTAIGVWTIDAIFDINLDDILTSEEVLAICSVIIMIREKVSYMFYVRANKKSDDWNDYILYRLIRMVFYIANIVMILFSTWLISLII